VLVVIGLVVVLSGGEKGRDTTGVTKAAVASAPSEPPKAPVPVPEPAAQTPTAEPAEATEKEIIEPAAAAEPAKSTEKPSPDPPVEETKEPQAPVVTAIGPADLMMALTFDKGQGYPDVVKPGKLNKIVEALKNNPNSRIVITGHTSSEGATVNNYDLGLKRAKRVRDMLIKMGIHKSRFETRSLGEKNPLVENDSEQNRRKNRRVDVEITR
jgi:outer membrane protein OmpA-like peptidoglycan-associated protein